MWARISSTSHRLLASLRPMLDASQRVKTCETRTSSRAEDVVGRGLGDTVVASHAENEVAQIGDSLGEPPGDGVLPRAVEAAPWAGVEAKFPRAEKAPCSRR